MLNLQVSRTIESAVALQLSGKSTTDRKMSALSQADSAGIVAISHGRGKVAKEAQNLKRADEFEGVVVAVGSGNFHVFAVAYAARTGQTVKFGRKDENGKWITKPSADFRKFGAVLEHAMLQLEDKNKVYTAKGDYSAAACDLNYLIELHATAVEVMDKLAEADRAKQASITADIVIENAAETVAA